MAQNGVAPLIHSPGFAISSGPNSSTDALGEPAGDESPPPPPQAATSATHPANQAAAATWTAYFTRRIISERFIPAFQQPLGIRPQLGMECSGEEYPPHFGHAFG